MSKILLLKISVLFDSISKNMYLSIQYKDINHITVFALELQHKLLAHPCCCSSYFYQHGQKSIIHFFQLGPPPLLGYVGKGGDSKLSLRSVSLPIIFYFLKMIGRHPKKIL